MRSEAWRPAAAARNRSPREAGTPPSRHYDLGARSSLHGSARHLPAVVGRRAPNEPEARPREPKTATMEKSAQPSGLRWTTMDPPSGWQLIALARHLSIAVDRGPC